MFRNLKGHLRRLQHSDLELVQKFYSSHYNGTIFSDWMLELPFWGLFIDEELAATGGTVVIDHYTNAANIGNFLTAPKFRGHGYGKTIAKALINDLLVTSGISVFTLGTTDKNIPAWKTYESVGFELLEKRIELEFAAV